MKIVKVTKYGGSLIVPLTGIVKEGDEYIVTKKEKQVILTPVDDIVKEERKET